MTKKNLFLVVGLVLIAFIAGCSNEVVYPEFPTSGYIRQTGDFLTGQSFDSSKFEVVATYLGGGQRVIENVAVSYQDTDGGVDGMSSDDVVTADLGTDYNGKPVTAKGSVTTYSISRLEVTGAEAYTVSDPDGSFEIPSSSLSVVAYYLDGEGEEQSVKLIPGEFIVKNENLNGLSETNPATQGTATVEATVGKYNNTVPATTQFVFSAVYESPVVSGALQSIEIIPGDYYVLAMTNQPTAPTLEDVTVIAKYETGTKILTAEDDVILQFVDPATKLPVTNGDFASNSNVVITAEYQNKTAETALYIKPVAMVAYPVSGYVTKNYVTGTEISAYPIDPADFDVILSVYADSEYKTLDSAKVLSEAEKENVEFFYYTDGDKRLEDTMPTTVDRLVYVGAEYNGVTYTPSTEDSSRVKAGVVVAVPEALPTAIADVKLVGTYQAPRSQYYNDVATINNTLAINAIQSLTIEYDTKDPVELSGFTSDNLSVEYSLTNDSVTELDKDSLADVDTIYIHVTYFYSDGEEVQTLEAYKPVSIEKAYATELDVDVEYAETTDDGAPLYGTTYDVIVKAVNANGVVAILAENEYTVDGTLPETVTAATEDDGITINALVDSETGKTLLTGKLVIAEPKAYVEVTALAIQAKEDAAKPLIGTAATRYFSDTTIASFEITGFTGFGGATVEFDETTPFTILKTAITEGRNIVYANLKYVAENGSEVKATVPYEFQGVDWVSRIVATPKADLEVITGQEYTADMFDFAVTLGSGKEYTSGLEVKINGSGAIVAGEAGRGESVVFDYTYNGISGQVTSGVVYPVSDYPVTVVPTQNQTIWYQAKYSEDQFDFAITWKSGLEYTDESGLTAPPVSYTFAPDTAGPNDVAQDVVITWTCGTATGDVTVSVTPGASI